MCHQRESHVFDDVQCTMYNVQCTMYNVQCTMYNVQCTITIHACMHACIHTWIHVYMYYIQTHMMQTFMLSTGYPMACYPPMACQEAQVKAGAPDASLILVVPYQPHQDEQWNVVSLDEWVDQECYKGIYYMIIYIWYYKWFNDV